MAAGIKLGSSIQYGAVSYPCSIRGVWSVLHNDLTATAETSTVLLNPATYAGTAVYPAEVAAGTRLLLRTRMLATVTTVTTAPEVCIFGGWGPETAYTEGTGVFTTDGTVTWSRLDNPAAGSSGITMPISATGYRDTTYRYGDIHDISGTDLLGCRWIIALTKTAGVVSGGADTKVQLLGCLIN